MQIVYLFRIARYCYNLTRAMESEKESRDNWRDVSRDVEKCRVKTAYLVAGIMQVLGVVITCRAPSNTEEIPTGGRPIRGTYRPPKVLSLPVGN